jgi:uncharacterized membrane protein YczE
MPAPGSSDPQQKKARTRAKVFLWLSIAVVVVGVIIGGPVGITLLFVGLVGTIATNVTWIVFDRRRKRQAAVTRGDGS